MQRPILAKEESNENEWCEQACAKQQNHVISSTELLSSVWFLSHDFAFYAEQAVVSVLMTAKGGEFLNITNCSSSCSAEQHTLNPF